MVAERATDQIKTARRSAAALLARAYREHREEVTRFADRKEQLALEAAPHAVDSGIRFTQSDFERRQEDFSEAKEAVDTAGIQGLTATSAAAGNVDGLLSEAAGAERDAIWREVQRDCFVALSKESVWAHRLWQGPGELAEAWARTKSAWDDAGPPWRAFAEIYDAFWMGQETHWDRLIEIVEIDRRSWEGGSRSVGEKLAEIDAEWADASPTALSLATVTDFFCDSTLRQMRLAGFDDDLAHLRDPDRVQRFVDDVQEARDGLQDFADYASDARGQTNAPAVLATAAEKMLAELERAQDREHVRARRIITLGKQLRGLGGEEAKRAEIGETLAGMLDDSIDFLADVCRRHFAPSIEVLNALDGLSLADTPASELIARFTQVLDRIDHADGHTLVPLSPDAAALLHDMLEEMKDTEASLAEAGSESFIARLRDRLASQAGALGATIGRYYEKGAPHADAAGKTADQAIKNYKRWKSLQDILAWLGDVFGGG